MRKISNSSKGEVEEYFSSFPEGTPVVMESTTGWEWLSDLLEEEGLEVKLANPYKVKLIEAVEHIIKKGKNKQVYKTRERKRFIQVSPYIGMVHKRPF